MISTDFLRVIARKGVNIFFFNHFVLLKELQAIMLYASFFFSTKVPMYHVYKLKIRVFNFCHYFLSAE